MSDQPTLVLRVDASAALGAGHLVRCLALARRVESLGRQVIFVARKLDGLASKLIAGQGFREVTLDDRAPEADDARATVGATAGVVLAGLLAVAAPQVRERLSTFRDPASTHSLRTRVQAWRDALAVWPRYPVVGAGANALRMVYPQHRAASHRGFRIFAENEYIQLVTEAGLAGVVLAGGLIAGLSVPFLAAVRRMREPADVIMGAEVESCECAVAWVERIDTVPRPEPVA